MSHARTACTRRLVSCAPLGSTVCLVRAPLLHAPCHTAPARLTYTHAPTAHASAGRHALQHFCEAHAAAAHPPAPAGGSSCTRRRSGGLISKLECELPRPTSWAPRAGRWGARRPARRQHARLSQSRWRNSPSPSPRLARCAAACARLPRRPLFTALLLLLAGAASFSQVRVSMRCTAADPATMRGRRAVAIQRRMGRVRAPVAPPDRGLCLCRCCHTRRSARR